MTEERLKTLCTKCKAEGYIREKKLGRPKKDEAFKVVEEACEIGMVVAWRKGVKCLKCGTFTPFMVCEEEREI